MLAAQPKSNPPPTLSSVFSQRGLSGKKAVTAVTGIVLVGFVVAHLLGNLKIFLGAQTLDTDAAFLRTMTEPL